MYLKSETSKELLAEQTEHVRTLRYDRLITSHQLFSSDRALWVFVLRDNLYSCRISLFSDQNHSDSNKSSRSWFISAAWEEKLLINIIQTGTRICSDILLTIFERKQYVGMEYSDEQTKWCIPQCIWPLLMW